ncbi:hypothetical protein [Rickettsia asembonensis]|uniref:hypothetical protein n=1 Tax=Rickettsia asembonensis TaxID=1068590 RepID=UPI0018F2407D|nr:hypothetical protein [Rickettsia asembonensis]
MHGPVKPTVLHSSLDHGVRKNNKNTNNFSIFNWIPWSSHGMTEGKLIHAGNTTYFLFIYKYTINGLALAVFAMPLKK